MLIKNTKHSVDVTSTLIDWLHGKNGFTEVF